MDETTSSSPAKETPVSSATPVEPSKPGNNTWIFVAIGCCLLLIIVIIIGASVAGFSLFSIFNKASETASNSTSSWNDWTDTSSDTSTDSTSNGLFDTNSLLGYHNDSVDYRNDIVDSLDALTGIINEDKSAQAIRDGIATMQTKIDAFDVYIATPSESDQLDTLHQKYLTQINKVAAEAEQLAVNFSDDTKYNEHIDLYNKAIDDLNAVNDEINTYVETM